MEVNSNRLVPSHVRLSYPTYKSVATIPCEAELSVNTCVMYGVCRQSHVPSTLPSECKSTVLVISGLAVQPKATVASENNKANTGGREQRLLATLEGQNNKKPDGKNSTLVFKACGWGPQHLGSTEAHSRGEPGASAAVDSRNSQEYGELTQGNERCVTARSHRASFWACCTLWPHAARTTAVQRHKACTDVFLSMNASTLTDARVPLDSARSAQTAKKRQLIIANVAAVQRECMETLGM